MLRIYGTIKANVGGNSEFHGLNRVEDPRLREHLLAMNTKHRPTTSEALGPFEVAETLPTWFVHLLEHDEPFATFGTARANHHAS
jgi:hypothetical protein